MRGTTLGSIGLFAVFSFVFWGCLDDPGTPCDNDDDCCSDGPAYLCQQGECVYNQFVANDWRVYNARVRTCNGDSTGDGGHDPSSGSGPTSGPGAGPGQCSGMPEQVGTEELAESGITRDACEFPTNQELTICAQNDAQSGINGLPTILRYDSLVESVKRRAEMDASVPIGVVADLQSIISFGGGVTGHERILVDGKFLDILLEYGQYVGMSAEGLASEPPFIAIDRIVAYHNSQPGSNLDPGFYVAQSPGAQDVANTLFNELAATIIFHEYGHYWSWVCVDQLRVQSSGWNALNYWPSRSEDEADMISGVLSAKIGTPPENAKFMLDLMAYYVLQRQGYASSFTEVTSSYGQLVDPSSNYSSLAGRKNFIDQGYNNWNLYGD